MRRLVLIPLSILLLIFPLLMIPAVAVHAEPGVRIMEDNNGRVDTVGKAASGISGFFSKKK